MNTIFDLSTSFVVAFFCFLLLSRLFARSENDALYRKKIDKRLRILAKQRETLMETSVEKMSTFMMAENEEWSTQAENSADTAIDKVRVIMKKAGIVDVSTNMFMAICLASGVVLTSVLIYFEFTDFFICIISGMPAGMYLVYNFFASQASKRKSLFLQQFPDAIDMMIRGVKAGLNISRVIKLVSIESIDPIASEYRTISQKFDMGIKPDEVLVEAANRINIEEFRFLVVALVLQMENGGVLVEILTNLSSLVRKRLEFGLKVKAMSSEARMSAIVISALPFVFAGIMMFVNPSHMETLIKPGAGQTLLKSGIVLFSIGTFVMMKIASVKV